MIIRFFLKKIGENKIRLYFTVTMVSFSLFLAIFFLTLGFNGQGGVKAWYQENVKNRIIYAEVTDASNLSILKNRSGILKETAMKKYEETIVEFANNKIELEVKAFAASVEFVIPGGELLAGSSSYIQDGIMVGKNILDYYNISYSAAIGMKVMMSDLKNYTIAGVFDNTEEMAPACFIMCPDVKFEADQYIIETNTIDDVATVTARFEKNGYKVVSYAAQIDETMQHIRIMAVAVTILSFGTLIFAWMTLYYSLMGSIRDMYPFIAMLKAVGYKRRNSSKLIYAESIIILCLSFILTIVLYYVGLKGIGILCNQLGVTTIQGLLVENLLKPQTIILFGSFTAVFIGMLTVNQCCIHKLGKLQVYEILGEVNQ